MRSTVQQSTATRQSIGTISAVWNKPNVDLEQEREKAVNPGRQFPKPATGTIGSAENKPTSHGPIGFDFINLPIFPPQQVWIQPKLKINQPGDKYEQEADVMAEKVMRMQDSGFGSVQPSPLQKVHRKCTTCGKEEEVHQSEKENADKQPPQRMIMRKCAACEEEEKNNKKKELLQRKEMNGSTPQVTTAVSQALQTHGKPLDTSTRVFMEQRFGFDFGKVRIHDDSISHQSSKNINALAYTHRNHIVFGAGNYEPQTYYGKLLLAHELTHTLQQNGDQNIVQRTPEVVDIPDKEKGRTCKAERKYEILEKAASPSAKFDVDSTNVTLNIKWCRDKISGDITIGANVPEQAAKIAKDIIDIVRRGGGSSEIEEKLRDADLTPFVDIIIKKGGAFSLTAHGEITVDSTGITGGKASLDLDLGPVTISPGVKSENGGIEGRLDVKGTWGGRKAPEVKCETKKVRIGKKLMCECPTPATKIPGEIETPFFPETKFLYFDYNSVDINKERSSNSLPEISLLLSKGYRVTSITGFTSPEGTLKPSPGFEGNEELAGKRAQAALALINQICSPLKMRDLVDCDPNVAKEVKPVGEGELHSANNEQGKELKGKALDSHAVSSFEGNEEEQKHLNVLSEEERKDLANAKTAGDKTRFIYPLLRRVKIMFAKTGMQKIPIEIPIPPGKEPCPPEVLKQAEDKLPKMSF